MVTSIARQSVLIKCNMQSSIMIGNYEFYYGAGLFCKIREISLPEEEIRPEQLMEFILPELQKFEGTDDKEKYLVKLLKNYKVLEDYDEQMSELLQWGLNETHIWQVNI